MEEDLEVMKQVIEQQFLNKVLRVKSGGSLLMVKM